MFFPIGFLNDVSAEFLGSSREAKWGFGPGIGLLATRDFLF